jgi:trehalose 6-phosphate phosphatase
MFRADAGTIRAMVALDHHSMEAKTLAVDQARHKHDPAQIDSTHVGSENAAHIALRQALREPDRWALFLDIDGTLLDLAPTPDSIVVPEGLPSDIQAFSRNLGGALALVTGRALDYADALFRPYRFPIAGLHGAEIRGADGQSIHVPASPDFERLKHAMMREAESMPGVLVEDKGSAVAAHYRLAPQFEEQLRERMQYYSQAAGPDWALQIGKFVFELRPSRASKGDALERFLGSPPFLDRLPLALGDDLTDESMFAVANARGGHSIRIGRPNASTCAQATAESPAHIRQALSELSG